MLRPRGIGKKTSRAWTQGWQEPPVLTGVKRGRSRKFGSVYEEFDGVKRNASFLEEISWGFKDVFTRLSELFDPFAQGEDGWLSSSLII
jgi:hypothetical protein